jgi:hypothetical protein
MASDEQEEQFSSIKAGSVARRARRIQARHIATPPSPPAPTEQVAAPSRRMVRHLAAPSQLAEEWRAAPGRHGDTGVVAAVDDTASYRASHACDRAIRHQHARNCTLPADKEAGYAEID